MQDFVINGRFLGQRLSGVQRFALETTAALQALAEAGAAPRFTVLRPPGESADPLPQLAQKVVGSRHGQAWEQLDLPRHTGGALLVNLGNTAPLLAGRRQAVVIHDAGVFDTPDSYSRAFRTWYRFLHRGLAWRGARLLTVSEFSRGRIAERLGVDAARIGVVPESGEHILHAPAETGVLAQYGLQPGRYAVAVGNRAAHKNLAGLGAAIDLLAGRGLSLAVIGGGGGIFRDGSGGPGAGAIALGRVSDAELRALYEGAVCLIFPSRYEGFGLPPLEAMCCGCPVIAARSGAVPEVCGEAALYADMNAGDGVNAVLTRLLDDAGLAAELRRRGHERAAFYTWRRAAETLLGHLDRRD